MTADDSATAPVLDIAYLDDMRGWIGDDTLATLLDGAPASIEDEVAKIRALWQAGDLAAARESGHRLKGAAGSVACRRLSLLGQKVQLAASLDADGVLDELEAVCTLSLTELAAYRAGLAA